MNNSERLHLDIRPDEAFATINTKEELLDAYRQLKDIEATLKDNLDALKEKASDIAPELLVAKLLRRWSYKPGIHKLSAQYFSLKVSEVNSVYDSAEGGDKFLKKYGLSFTEATSISWNPGILKEKRGAN